RPRQEPLRQIDCPGQSVANGILELGARDANVEGDLTSPVIDEGDAARLDGYSGLSRRGKRYFGFFGERLQHRQLFPPAVASTSIVLDVISHCESGNEDGLYDEPIEVLSAEEVLAFVIQYDDLAAFDSDKRKVERSSP